METRSSSIMIFILAMISIWTTLQLNKEKEKSEIIKQQLFETQKSLDSLEDDIFKMEIKLFKYEKAYEIIKKEDSTTGSHFSDIILDETE